MEEEEYFLDMEDDSDMDECWHIAIVSISKTECQCMDCLRKWPKEKDFKSDFPQYDRS